LQPFYFTSKVDTDILHMATRQMEAESPRALFDLSMRVPFRTPPFGTPMFVLGAAGDRIVRPDDARATATQHGVEAVIVPGLAHMMMLEPGWETPAKALADWIDSL
jgi:pimeloyl-ACP methyl ester carboxylesterase